MANDHFFDSWQEDDLHFFVFQLRPAMGTMNGNSTEIDAPVAVFVMHAESSAPVSAVVVTPLPSGTEAEIRDLLMPDMIYVAPVTT